MDRIKQSLPDSWGFDRDFLADPSSLPPFLPTVDLPSLAPSRRIEQRDLRTTFQLATDFDAPAQLAAHLAAIPWVHVLCSDPSRQRHDLFGPAWLQLPEDLLNRHLLFIGPPGTGKTSQGLLPLVANLLADRKRTLVLFDPKGDQFDVVRTLAVRSGRKAQRVFRLNLTDPAASIGWNPLWRAMTRTDAHGIATALVMASETGSSDTPFWRNNSIDLITHALLGLAKDESETLTLPRLCEVLDLPRPQLLAWLRAHGCQKFATFLESGSHNAETCLTDTSIRLLPLLDRDLCAVLSHAELSLPDLFREPTVLVVEMNETRIERMRALFNVLVQQILDCGIEAAGRRPDARLRFPASVVLDELGSAIGAVPRFPIYLNTLRSRRISVIAAIQSTAQIHALYGAEAGAVLAGFSSKVFFPNVERIDAVLASEMSGTMAVRVQGGSGVADTLVARPVFLPEEVARPKEHPVLGRPVLAILADALPAQVYLTPSYRLPGLRELLLQQRSRRRRSRRGRPLEYQPREGDAQAGSREAVGPTNTQGWSPERIQQRLAETKQKLDWGQTNPSARKWWEVFEAENRGRLALVLRLAEELATRKATVTEFYLAHVFSQTDNIQANLHYLDYSRLKKESDRKRAEQRQQRQQPGQQKLDAESSGGAAG